MAKKIDFNKPLKWVLIAYAAFALVGVIIVVVVITAYVEETVTFQLSDLMQFEIETNCLHIISCFLIITNPILSHTFF